MRQSALTVTAPIRTERVDQLEQALQRFPCDPCFSQVESLHFARWVVLAPAKSPDPADRDFPATLLFSTHYDGPESEHLQQLVAAAPEALTAIYENCIGFDAEAGNSPEVRVRGYLERHAEAASAFYVGARGRSVAQIQEEKRLVDCIREFLASALEPDADLRDLHYRIRGHVRDQGIEPFPIVERRRPAFWDYRAVLLAAGFGLVVLALLLWFPLWVRFLFLLGSLVVLAAVVLAICLLRVQEEQDTEVQAAEERASAALRRRVEMEREKQLADNEDRGIQNELTTVVAIKAGRLRRILLRVILFLGSLATRYYWNWTGGRLLGISSIHFAHWAVTDSGRRLVFVSNYNESWASYLDDFVQHGSGWLTAIWGQCVNFPRTRYLVFDGAADGPRFKQWARSTQEGADVWYSAYPELSIQDVNRNTRIARGLWQEEMDRFALREWLALL